MTIRFDDRVAIVTGAGSGLGRAHALGLAARGARVVVNDLGTDHNTPSDAALGVVEDILASGGQARASGADVSQVDAVDAMVNDTVAAWGRVDVLVNNAGILRDKTFANMPLSDFDTVQAVHLRGSVNCTQRAWPLFRAQGYGRVVFTSSASGLYGNFGQTNYAAAKAAMVGLMNVLHLEGQRDNIRVNTLCPTAATQMTEQLLPADLSPLLQPETITPGLLYLVSEDAPSRVILSAGAGCYAQTVITETDGICLSADNNTPEAVATRFDDICNRDTLHDIDSAFDQTRRFAERAASKRTQDTHHA